MTPPLDGPTTIEAMTQDPGPDVEAEIARHYERCVEVITTRDAAGFVEWFGPQSSFIRSDGRRALWQDTKPFWEWRFSKVIETRHFMIEVERVVIDSDGLIVVDFHEAHSLVVVGTDGRPAVREADLHNRNRWRRVQGQLSSVDGAELTVRRTLDGVAMDDDADPMGFAAWREHSSRGGAS